MFPISDLVPLFGIIFTFGIPGIIIFWWLYTRHRERMRLIEKGLAPEEVKAYFQNVTVSKKRYSFSALKWGIILTFIGLGILVSNIMYEFYDFDEGISFGIIIMFAGLGFLVYFLALNRKENSGEEKPKTDFNN